MTYMPIGNDGAEGQQGHKGKGSRGGSDRTDPVSGGTPWSWVVSLGARAAGLSHSGVPINENLVEPPAWLEALGNDARGGPWWPEGSFSLWRGQVLLNALNIAGDSRKSGSRGVFPESFEVWFHTSFETSPILQSRWRAVSWALKAEGM